MAFPSTGSGSACHPRGGFMKLLSIIIVSYISPVEIGRLVSQLQRARIDNWNIKIIVVDNGSNNETKVILKELQKKKYIETLVFNTENKGFAAAANQCIQIALTTKSDRIMLLNQDVEIETNQLEILLNNNYDIIAPVIRFQRNKQWIYDYGGKVNYIFGRTYHIERVKKDDINNKVDYVSGCCILIRRNVFETVGLFDVQYFMYFEDVDFCLRAQKAGFTVNVENKSIITHHLHEQNKKSVRQNMYLIESNYRFISNSIHPIFKPIAYSYIAVLFLKILINKLKSY